MPDRPYTVFTQDAEYRKKLTDAGLLEDEFWRAHGPIPASSPDAAIGKLRDMSPALKTDKTALFHAEANFEPKRMVRRFVETYDLRPASESDQEPPTEQMEVGS